LTGHQDRPDVRQRRRVTRLRAELGLATVPPHVGAELRTIAPRISEQVARLLRQGDPYLALSPNGQRQLLSAIGRAVEEFARLVEDRPPNAPAVEVMLVEIVRAEAQPESCRAALHAAFQTVQEVTRVLWPQLPQARPYAAQLDVAAARYAQRLCARTMNAQRTQSARTKPAPVADASHLDGLIALVEHRWGTVQAVQLYLSVSTLGTAEVPPPRTVAHQEMTRPLRLVTTDHVVTITQHPIPTPRTASGTDGPVVVCVGPVPMSGIALVHDTALLLLRLIRAGVAAPPSPVQIQAPNLGFLHPYPSEASVRKIRDLLLPLTGQGGHRRSALARTLQLRLRTAATAQALARQLAMHPQTVHNHLAALRNLYNSDLDFAEDNLAMQAAVDLVLPLWELETSGRRTPPSPADKKVT
jgi:hypothetical protein